MKVLVCGSRDFTNYELLEETLNGLTIDSIIEGDARGADRLSEYYAQRHGISLDIYPALWDQHGKAAGSIRNAQMLAEGKPNLIVAFWDGESRGTKNMIDQATKAGVEVKVIEI